jgi:hypothetical protein
VTPAKKPRRKHPRVVDHYDIAVVEELGQPIDRGVRTGAAAAVEMQQTGGTADGRRFLRNQFRRKSKGELADVHPQAMLPVRGVAGVASGRWR